MLYLEKFCRFEFPGVSGRIPSPALDFVIPGPRPDVVRLFFYVVVNIDSILKVQMIPQRGRMLFRNSYLLHSIHRPQTTVALSSPISNHIKSWVDAYEEFIGVSAVKDAQSQVMKVSYLTSKIFSNYAHISGLSSYCPSGLGTSSRQSVFKWEERLSDAQLLRRDKQAELKNIQGRLKEIHFDLDRTSRGEDKYGNIMALRNGRRYCNLMPSARESSKFWHISKMWIL